MKHRIFALALLAGMHAGASAQSDAELGTDVQKFSYGLGLQIGQNLKNQGLSKIDAEAMAAAIDDVLNGRDMRLSVDELRAAAVKYREEMLRDRAAVAENNGKKGEAFLAQNGERDEVVTLDSGLQYRVVEDGAGDKPTETDTVVVHYRGKLLDGTEFDSSYGRGEPTELEVAQVIPGWQQALQLMPTGSHWEVWVPASLA
ncbi:MAG: FKBP-type peptidyl-prolyl cis-trans isomerase, partial [Gammaproteobacteria bacterium]|nr:FKBP-type peptidyl-prolyl cis-trans isomerase [Gammaproteobacteria bacterium]